MYNATLKLVANSFRVPSNKRVMALRTVGFKD